ncbi:hypothetical protein BDV59DRAFT_200566 [Aspergillus ambiguus]|uniref:uncharacterized protein n=1 Tax=Aspergillus ambiguus TaxID=176160 RepID=UPI003CCDA29B
MASLEDRSNITRLEVDVTSSESIAAVVKAISESTDRKLDYLVNNAAQTIVMLALDTNIEEAKRMYDVNLWGLIAVSSIFTLHHRVARDDCEHLLDQFLSPRALHEYSSGIKGSIEYNVS